jgi:putative restriction endonuclease
VTVEAELDHRLGLWRQLAEAGGPSGIQPSRLRELGIYVGSQGVFFNKERTDRISPGGVTMSVLHTGGSYADDFSTDGVLYHYPATARAPTRDASEIAATKAAATLRLPVFVITNSNRSPSLRDIHLGWVVDWDDDARLFLILFGEVPLPTARADAEVVADEGFILFDPKPPGSRIIAARDGQQRFKFEVLKRYGAQCAACAVAVLDVLDAAHLVPKAKGGTDHPANGIVLCALHHRAFDAGLFAIEPETHRIQVRAKGPSHEAQRISRKDLRHLRAPPHADAVLWLWERWK